MNNFSSFVKEENLNNKCNTKKCEDVGNTEKLEEMIDKYSKYSNDKLLNEFMKLTLEKKKKGLLSNDELNALKSTLLPYLNNEQRENLNKVIEMVKDV